MENHYENQRQESPRRNRHYRPRPHTTINLIGLVMLFLAATFGQWLIIVSFASELFKEYSWMAYPILLLALFILCSLVFTETLRRRIPNNWISILMVVELVIMGSAMITVWTGWLDIILAFTLAFLMTISLVIFGIVTKSLYLDFVSVFGCASIVLGCTIVFGWVGRSRGISNWSVVFFYVALFIVALFLVYHVQTVASYHRTQTYHKDYCTTVLVIYIDFVIIFMIFIFSLASIGLISFSHCGAEFNYCNLNNCKYLALNVKKFSMQDPTTESPTAYAFINTTTAVKPILTILTTTATLAAQLTTTTTESLVDNKKYKRAHIIAQNQHQDGSSVKEYKCPKGPYLLTFNETKHTIATMEYCFKKAGGSFESICAARQMYYIGNDPNYFCSFKCFLEHYNAVKDDVLSTNYREFLAERCAPEPIALLELQCKFPHISECAYIFEEYRCYKRLNANCYTYDFFLERMPSNP